MQVSHKNNNNNKHNNKNRETVSKQSTADL